MQEHFWFFFRASAFRCRFMRFIFFLCLCAIVRATTLTGQCASSNSVAVGTINLSTNSWTSLGPLAGYIPYAGCIGQPDSATFYAVLKNHTKQPVMVTISAGKTQAVPLTPPLITPQTLVYVSSSKLLGLCFEGSSNPQLSFYFINPSTGNMDWFGDLPSSWQVGSSEIIYDAKHGYIYMAASDGPNINAILKISLKDSTVTPIPISSLVVQFAFNASTGIFYGLAQDVNSNYSVVSIDLEGNLTNLVNLDALGGGYAPNSVALADSMFYITYEAAAGAEGIMSVDLENGEISVLSSKPSTMEANRFSSLATKCVKDSCMASLSTSPRFGIMNCVSRPTWPNSRKWIPCSRRRSSRTQHLYDGRSGSTQVKGFAGPFKNVSVTVLRTPCGEEEPVTRLRSHIPMYA